MLLRVRLPSRRAAPPKQSLDGAPAFRVGRPPETPERLDLQSYLDDLFGELIVFSVQFLKIAIEGV
jgi:hypothetical protein